MIMKLSYEIVKNRSKAFDNHKSRRSKTKVGDEDFEKKIISNIQTLPPDKLKEVDQMLLDYIMNLSKTDN